MPHVDDTWWDTEATPQDRQRVSDMLRFDPDLLDMLGLR